MAAELVGGALLSSLLGVVFERLSSPEVANLIRGKKLDPTLLQRLETTLYVVQAVLNDAEQKQINDPSVKKWLDRLQDAVYEADDLLDEVSTKATTRKEVRNFWTRFLNLPDREMVKRLEDITTKLESIVKLKENLGLKETERENMSWRTSTSLLDGSNIYGRDQEKESILKLLLDDDDRSDGRISVIPIVGMGGVGKTTLARLVYNDDSLEGKFDLKAWVCVSEEFDIRKVTKTIVENVTRSACNMNDLNLLQLDLKDKLTGKKFLIVLDDVWIENYDNWKDLKKPFHSGMKGSRILVTTRSEKVASVVQTLQGYYLKELSNEDCWLVFASHACISSESSGNKTLEKIGREIVKKCKGLPLAAESLGGLLRTKHEIRDWNTILKSDIWKLSENENKIIPALRISYHYLPPHLKRCFVYCSLYPKDYEFDKDELILLWMAEDLLQPPKKEEKTLEEVGYEYFNDLASRSFFRRLSTPNNSFVMHDLMHDLATSIGGEFYLGSAELGRATNISIKTRHLSCSGDSLSICENPEAFDRVKFVRTILLIKSGFPPLNIEKALHLIPLKLKYLRVVSFHSVWELSALPDSIGELIHLRYLDLSQTCIWTLPESLSNLYNLQTLKLKGCFLLSMLPSGMQNLVNLRHLDISGTRIKEMPRGMSKLSHLQFLSDFVVGKHEENGIMELGEISHLHGFLSISNLENVGNSHEASGARIMDKKHINKLRLRWSSTENFADSQTERDILDKLQPHKGLEALEIYNYRGTRFPDWVGHSSYHTMTDLYLSDCNYCYELPSFGQLPSLKSLNISGLHGLETVDTKFYKNDGDSCWVTPFPCLQRLKFYNMPDWQVWCSWESGAFPQLKELSVRKCPKLRGDVPNHLPALEELVIAGCEQLTSSLPMAPAIRYLKISKSDKIALQELPPSLHSLTIRGSQVVESTFEAITNNQPTCLQSLRLRNCSSSISFPGGCIPASMKRLVIEDCRKLEFPKQQLHESLVSLLMRGSCDSLTSFSLETFPNLVNLFIEECENLESVSASPDAALQSLNSFIIRGCSNLVWFPREGLPAPSMTYFQVSRCVKIKSLPCHMNTLLPKLESLWISDCPEIESFPEGGLPPNLRSLTIGNSEKLLSSLALMDVEKACLTHLTIYGPCESVMSFPKEGLLPPSLTSLHLKGLSSLETLECKGLLHLTSLQQLSVSRCRKLENMAGERLPASLIQLHILGSPFLEEGIRKKHQEIWPKISQIRHIEVTRGMDFVT